MKKKIIFLILSFITIYLILSYKGVIRIKYYIERYKANVKAHEIDKKLDEILKPSELLNYYKQLKDLDEEDVLCKREKDVRVKGIVIISGNWEDPSDIDFGEKENNKVIFGPDIAIYFEKLSEGDVIKLKKYSNHSTSLIFFGKVTVGGKNHPILFFRATKFELPEDEEKKGI
jgi:hypothetical protein